MDVEEKRPRLLLGCTGSVASIKVAELCHLLIQFADIKLIVTSSAKNFIKEDDLPAEVLPVLGDEAEWRDWRAVGDPVLHIELRRWADALLVAPLSANTLAKMANGMADNLLTCVVRAWDFSKPLLVAPAMNTAMWVSPFTARHLTTLTELGRSSSTGSGRSRGGSSSSTVGVIQPVSKRLACGDEGTGAMAAPEDIAARCRTVLLPPPPRAHVAGGGNGAAEAVPPAALVTPEAVAAAAAAAAAALSQPPQQPEQHLNGGGPLTGKDVAVATAEAEAAAKRATVAVTTAEYMAAAKAAAAAATAGLGKARDS